MTIRNPLLLSAWVRLTRLPEAMAAAWLLFLAGAIWTHTHATHQAPIYDGFGYYQKAFNFWSSVRTQDWFNPLNVEPTFRPPGTVLMSYPFGFDPDPRGFYFRSVYFPAILLFSAVLVGNYANRLSMRDRWLIVVIASFFTTMTLSYHFEFGAWTGGYWGLVDSFLAGLGALAAAAAWRGTRPAASMFRWAFVVGLASSLSILVKPSGAFVAAIAGVGWAIFSLSRVLEAWLSPETKKVLFRRLLASGVIIFIMDLLTISVSLLSGYLSSANLKYGQAAISVMKVELALPLSQLWNVINTGFGVALLVWVGMSVLILVQASTRDRARIVSVTLAGGLIASLFAILFGVWFWFVGSGGATQIRYAVPFFMMALVWLTPAVLQAWRVATLALTIPCWGIMIVATLNLALLLVVPRPSLSWQQVSGVGLTAEIPSDVTLALKQLVTKPPQPSLRIYVFSMDTSDAILESLIDQQRLLHPDAGSLLLNRPIDWVRPSTFRIDEIVSSNYLMTNPQQTYEAPASSRVQNFGEEQGTLTKWVDSLTDDDGVAAYFESSTAKIVTVTDAGKLRASIDKLVQSHDWDRVFQIANNISAAKAGPPPR